MVDITVLIYVQDMSEVKTLKNNLFCTLPAKK